mmetsp:Transcript_11115/g.22542  ORF Transcript_11115/g.22542 Transcript_11115/m.22542 type:complete len:249 (+) Transcript_11115:82-828(+)
MTTTESESGIESFFEKIDSCATAPEPTSYACSDVPVTYALELPIPIAVRGSSINYSFSSENGDVAFGIYLRPAANSTNASTEDVEEEEVVPLERVDSNVEPVTGSFLVTEAPCVAVLVWDNNHSWLRSKVLSYSVTVKPPSEEILRKKYLTQLNTSLSNASIDKRQAESRLAKVMASKSEAEATVAKLKQELSNVIAGLGQIEKEETYLRDRMAFRGKQIEGLESRLEAAKAAQKNGSGHLGGGLYEA